ncbi:MAG: 16S rRNA (cytosine(967)-C(5))-methyltransferase RsmB [Candidatus Eremiobacterota bacterium]
MKQFRENNPRYIAFEILQSKKSQNNLAVTLNKCNLSAQDRALVTQLVQGVNRQQLFLERVISLTSSCRKIERGVKILLYLGAYQLLCLDKIPPYAAISETVEIGKSLFKPHIVKYINGVLRSVERKKHLLMEKPDTGNDITDMSVYYSHPEWMIKRWIKRWGKDFTGEICKFNNTPPPLTIRINTLKTKRETLSDMFEKVGLDTNPLRFIPEGLQILKNYRLENLDCYKDGFFTIQGEASMFPAKCLAPKEGDTVLDLCAAPGNKTTHTAELMNNRGKILAVDISEKRLKALSSSCSRLGINIVNTMVSDVITLSNNMKEAFDCVLLDAPCSGTGVLARHSDSRWNRDIDDVKRLSLVQKKMIDEASHFVKQGGSMVYSVCSIEPEEGEEIVKNFLEAHKDFISENPFSDIENRASAGILLLPPLHGTEGFFIAKFRRKF